MKALKALKAYKTKVKSDSKTKNRFIVVSVSFLLIADYLMYCFLVGQNVFAILPSIPALDSREEITIYLPDPDNEPMITETRLISGDSSDKNIISYIVHQTVRGSKYENTRKAVPIDCNIRTVWIKDGVCYIDIRLEHVEPTAPRIEGSEKKFRDAVEKSVTTNFPAVKKVVFLQNGIYNRELWESSTSTTGDDA